MRPSGMRWLLPLFVVGCVSESKPVEHRETPQLSLMIRTWLEASEIGIDCPMSVAVARDVRVSSRRHFGDVARVMGDIACLCDVVPAGGRLDYDRTCTREPDRAVMQTRDEQRLLAWQHAVVAKVRAGVAPSRLARSTPLRKQLAELHTRTADRL